MGAATNKCCETDTDSRYEVSDSLQVMQQHWERNDEKMSADRYLESHASNDTLSQLEFRSSASDGDCRSTVSEGMCREDSQRFDDPGSMMASVNLKEFQSFLENCRKNVEPDALPKLLEVADANQDGNLDWSEIQETMRIVNSLKKPLKKNMLQDKVAYVELTGHTLAASMKMRCDISGAAYVLYWVEVDGSFVVTGSYVPPEHKSLLKQESAKQGWVQQCELLKLDRSSLVARVAESKEAVFIQDAPADSLYTRTELCKQFGITSVCIIPFEDGVLEYGSLQSWAEAPKCPTMPKAQMRAAFDNFGACYTMFWQEKPEGFVAVAEYVSPQRKKAMQNRRGDDKTFSSQSRLQTLGPDSTVASVVKTQRELFISNAMDHTKFTRGALAQEFGIKCVRMIPCEGGVLEYGVPSDEHLTGHALEAVLKMRCDVTGAAYAMYWVEMDGAFVVSGYYINSKSKTPLQDSEQGYTSQCQQLKLGPESIIAKVSKNGEECFIPVVCEDSTFPRKAMCSKFGIQSVHAVPITGGVCEYGFTELCTDPPECPLVPMPLLKRAFQKFGACYVILWVETSGEWTVAAEYSTEEYVNRMQSRRGSPDTFSSKCCQLKLGDDSIVALAARSKAKQAVDDLRKPSKFTEKSVVAYTRMTLAKQFDIKSVVAIPVERYVVFEYGNAVPKQNSKRAE